MGRGGVGPVPPRSDMEAGTVTSYQAEGFAERALRTGWEEFSDTSWLLGRWPKVMAARTQREVGLYRAFRLRHPRGRVVMVAAVPGGPFHAVAVERPGPGPRLHLIPESWTKQISAVMGSPEIQIGHPGFDARWEVQAEDPGSARALLTGYVVDRLLWPDSSGLRVLLDVEDLVVYVQSPPHPSTTERMLQVAFDLQGLLRSGTTLRPEP